MTTAELAVPSDNVTRILLGLGALAGPVYLVTGFGQALLRPGFDLTRHPLSLLANGDWGWIQVANFIVTAVLVLAGAVGLVRATKSRGDGVSGALIALYGLSLVGAGFFKADAGAGFPPDAPAVAEITFNGIMHFAVGSVGFLALIAAAIMRAMAFWRRGESGWGWFSAVTGIGFFAAFIGIGAGAGNPATVVAFYAAVVLAFTWLTLLFARVARQL